MRDWAFPSVGTGLLLTGSSVRATAWAAGDHVGPFAGAIGLGLGAMLLEDWLADSSTY